MQIILQAIEGIEAMLRGELRGLEESVQSIVGDSQLVSSVVRKVRTVSNLTKTMGGLFKNTV